MGKKKKRAKTKKLFFGNVAEYLEEDNCIEGRLTTNDVSLFLNLKNTHGKKEGKKKEKNGCF